MKYWVALIVLVVASASTSAYTGICFLDAILNTLDSISAWVKNVMNPTTTTIATTTTIKPTTTSTTSPTTTSSTTYPTSSSTTTTYFTTTTLFAGECASVKDCPATSVVYRCNFDGNVVRETRFFFCASPGSPESKCKSKQSQLVDDICNIEEKCVEGTDHCVED